MEARLDYYAAAPGAVRALFGLETYLVGCGLGKPLLDLVKLSASQLNGYAFCTSGTRQRGRGRAAALPARRLAGVASLHRSRAGRPGLDGSGHAHFRRPRVGRSVRRRPPTLLRQRTGRPDPGRRCHQRLEPNVHQLPSSPRTNLNSSKESEVRVVTWITFPVSPSWSWRETKARFDTIKEGMQ